MFCSYCGATLAQGASFCASCGNRISNGAPMVETPVRTTYTTDAHVHHMVAEKEATRKSEMLSLTNAWTYFSKKSDRFKEYDYICHQLMHYARGAKSALIVWGAIISAFSLILLISLMTEKNYTFDTLWPAYCFTLFPGILMIVGGIFMKVNNRRKYARYQDLYALVSTELYNHYIMYPDCPVGAEFANPQILEQLLRVIQSGRADTVKESINIYISGRRQAKMQNYLAELARSTSAINLRTGVLTTFAAADVVL